MQDFEHIEVEVKAVETLQQAERLIIELQKQLKGFEQTAVITSFDLKIHQALQQQQSIFKRGLLIEQDIKEQAIEQALQQLMTLFKPHKMPNSTLACGQSMILNGQNIFKV